ncbi:MAG TPA: hypothetical protein VHN78_05680 [Chloroflexota bacterium]|nr:hypothetical protein [Chloroflexota bacterium]
MAATPPPGLFLALAAAAGLALTNSLPIGPAVEVRDLDEGGRLLATVPLLAPGTFDLLFTHSMYGGEVVETYRVAGQPSPRLERSAVRTERSGAAEYYARYGDFRRGSEGWVLETERLELARLPLRVDRTGSPAIQVGARRLPLLGLVPDGHLAELRPVVVGRHRGSHVPR